VREDEHAGAEALEQPPLRIELEDRIDVRIEACVRAAALEEPDVAARVDVDRVDEPIARPAGIATTLTASRRTHQDGLPVPGRASAVRRSGASP